METAITSFNMDNSLELPVVVPVIEEYVVVEKKVIEGGGVIVRKLVSEVADDVNTPLFHDEYEVKHVAVNLFVDDAIPSVRHEGDTMIIPVLKEVMVKRTMLVEEIRITRHTITETNRQTVHLRKETVTVERVDANDRNIDLQS